MPKKVSWKSIKIHRTYTVVEAAVCLGVHDRTVREWVAQGLPIMDRRRPMLIKGAHLKDFLKERHEASRRPLAPGELYCLGCKRPVTPLGKVVEWMSHVGGKGALSGACASCGRSVHRFAMRAVLDDITGDLKVTFRAHEKSLIDRTNSPSNTHFEKDSYSDETIQCRERTSEASIRQISGRGSRKLRRDGGPNSRLH